MGDLDGEILLDESAEGGIVDLGDDDVVVDDDLTADDSLAEDEEDDKEDLGLDLPEYD